MSAQTPRIELDSAVVARYARLALECVHREYPNKIAHVLSGDSDAQPPRKLHPAFYGCFDWHSAVHGHWLLVRLTRLFPRADFASAARRALDKNLTKTNIAGELAYLRAEGRASYERPYGLAWLLQLAAELHEWDDPDARRWRAALDPLAKECAQRFRDWLPKLSHPIRTGEHSQTAFALGLVHDWARVSKDDSLRKLVELRSRDYYAKDRGWSFGFEPSGQDFLSPGLAEADLMRRVLEPARFAAWLGVFLPQISLTPSTDWLEPAIVTDRNDGKLVHLDGLNIARAWMLEGIASGLPKNDPRILAIEAVAKQHRKAGLSAIANQSYEGGHWLGSFAVYLVTRRGLK